METVKHVEWALGQLLDLQLALNALQDMQIQTQEALVLPLALFVGLVLILLQVQAAAQIVLLGLMLELVEVLT